MESNNSMIESIYLTKQYTQTLEKATKATSDFRKQVDKAAKSLSIEMITKKRYTTVANQYTNSMKTAAKEVSDFRDQVDEAANSLKKMSTRKYDIRIDGLKSDDLIKNIKIVTQIEKGKSVNHDFKNFIPDDKIWSSMTSGITQFLGKAAAFSGKIGKIYENIKGTIAAIIGPPIMRTLTLFLLKIPEGFSKAAAVGTFVVGKIIGKGIKKIHTIIGKYLDWLGGAASEVLKMLAPAAGAIAGFSAKALVSAGEMEQTYMSLQRIIGDEGKTNQLMGGLKNVAITTPYDINELTQGSQLLLSYGFALDQVIPMLKTAGNASVGLNQGTEGVNSILNALGQIKAGGSLGMENMDQLAGMGIDAWKYLEKSTGSTRKEIEKMVRQGLMPADEAIQSIVGGMNQDPKFINQMHKQSKTLFGLFESIKEIFDLNILLPFGDGIKDGILPYLTKFVDKITNSQEKLQGFSDALFNIGNMAGEFLGQKMEQLMSYFETLNNDEAFQKMGFGDKLIEVISDALDAMIDWLDKGGSTKITELLNKGLQIFAKLVETIGPQLEDIGKSIAGAVTKGAIKGLGSLIPSPIEWVGSINKIRGKDLKNLYPKNKMDTSEANLPFAPNVNYPTLLNRRESALTAQANKSNEQSGNVTINIPKLADTIQASSPTDVDAFINKFKNELVMAAANMGGAG